MEPLVAVFVSLRRATRKALPLLGIVLLAAAVALAAAQPIDPRAFTVVVLSCLALLSVRAYKRASLVHASYLLDVEIGALLVVTAYAVAVHVDASLDKSYYPLVYVAIGVMSAFARPHASLTVIGAAMLFEAAVRAFAYGNIDLERLLPHVGFAMVFGLLNTLSLRLEVTRLRRASQGELEAERSRIQEQARSYRLLRAPSESQGREDDVERLLRSGVEEIELSVLLALRLLRESVGAHTAMLLWLDEDGRRLRISELSSEDPDLNEGPFATGDGILGVVLSRAQPVRVAHLKPSYVLPYYRDTCPVQSVCAAPVYEHGRARGVLVVDRLEDLPFDEREEGLVEEAARFIARAIENERVFVQLERTKVEQGTLYRAAERLGAAISEQQVVDAGVSAAREIAAVDFAAVTAYEADDDSHQIRAVDGDDALLNHRFKSNTGLVSMALKNRHPLPYRGEFDASQMVFDKRRAPPPMRSLLVLPLSVHDQPLGTLVLASREVGAFHDAARNLLEVLASHLAVSLSNARMVRRLEEQATTDGLTGLLNKRALLETATEKLRAARRFGRRLSVLISDIDHFKDVNDTYGHDAGDIVIRALAQIHETAKRNTDAVARFGGEEFVTICEETDAEGALLLAERIRSELEKTPFHVGGQTVHCTCSIGVATFPEAGTWEELFRAADTALYASKRAGRNRTTVYRSGSAPHAA